MCVMIENSFDRQYRAEPVREGVETMYQPPIKKLGEDIVRTARIHEGAEIDRNIQSSYFTITSNKVWGDLGSINGSVTKKLVNENSVNSVKSKGSKSVYDNTEPSLKGNFKEGVTTETRVYNVYNTCYDNNGSLCRSNSIERERSIRNDEDIVCTLVKTKEIGSDTNPVVIDSNIKREGFSRKLFTVQPVANNQVARVLVRKKDVVAYQVTSDVKVQEQRIRQTYIYPPEFVLACLIAIEDKEIAQAGTDLLDKKYQDGLEAILRREDLISRQLLIRGSTAFNDLVLFPTFTPAVLSTLRIQVNRWGNQASSLVIAYDIWDDIISDADFVRWWDQVHKHELILEGRLGSILGMEIITDGYRYPTLQVLQPGEVFVTASPVTLGSILQRKELDSRAVDFYNQGRAARGLETSPHNWN